MMRNKLIIIFSLIGFIILAIFATFFKNHQILRIDHKLFVLSAARTASEQTKGLSSIKSLNSRSGMIFLFDKKETLNFWMKDTLLPLQIVFIDGCKIVDEQEMSVEQDPSKPQKKYVSAEQADKAIELNRGSISDNLIGEKIEGLCK